jgi:hypothetical protein
MLKEHERVVLKTDVLAEKLRAGDVGTIVHVYNDGKAFEVEFVTLDGKTAAVVTLETAQVRPVSSGEITHARQFAA